jgi:chromosome segregation ATPase
MEIENLLKQREALDAQIDDVRTSHIRQQLADLRRNQQDLVQRLADAKAQRKLNDESVQLQIAEKKSELEKLKNIYYSDSYFISQLEEEMRSNSEKIKVLDAELKSLLSEV